MIIWVVVTSCWHCLKSEKKNEALDASLVLERISFYLMLLALHFYVGRQPISFHNLKNVCLGSGSAPTIWTRNRAWEATMRIEGSGSFSRSFRSKWQENPGWR